jgi:hypothetical protein
MKLSELADHSKWNVVVRDPNAPKVVCGFGILVCPTLRVMAAAHGSTIGSFRRRQQADLIDDDLGTIGFLASFFIVPGTRRDASLDIEFGSLLHIVAKNLGASRITYKVVPLCSLLPLATFILVPFAGCQGQVCDKRAARRRSDFGGSSRRFRAGLPY